MKEVKEMKRAPAARTELDSTDYTILNKLGATVANAGGDGGAAIEAYEALLREIVI